MRISQKKASVRDAVRDWHRSHLDAVRDLQFRRGPFLSAAWLAVHDIRDCALSLDAGRDWRLDLDASLTAWQSLGLLQHKQSFLEFVASFWGPLAFLFFLVPRDAWRLVGQIAKLLPTHVSQLIHPNVANGAGKAWPVR